MSFRPEVFVDGAWCGNALLFETREEAEKYCADLACRWTLVRETRAVERTEPATHEWSSIEGLGPIGGPKRFPAFRVQL